MAGALGRQGSEQSTKQRASARSRWSTTPPAQYHRPMDPLDVARLVPLLMARLQGLRATAMAHDRPFLLVAPADLANLRTRVDLGPLAEAWLHFGTPVEPLVVGEKRVMMQAYALIERLATLPDWPRHLLPVGEVGSQGLLALDERSGRIVEVAAGETLARTEPLTLLAELDAWLQCVAPAQFRPIRAYFAVDPSALTLLESQLGADWRERWLFQGLQPLADVRAQLEATLRLNRGTARICTLITAAAPLLGWWLGKVATPDQPWLGVGLALLVVGGVPGWLWAQAQREVRELQNCLNELSS